MCNSTSLCIPVIITHLCDVIYVYTQGSLSASSALMGSPITVGHVHAQFDDTLDVSRADSHSKLVCVFVFGFFRSGKQECAHCNDTNTKHT